MPEVVEEGAELHAALEEVEEVVEGVAAAVVQRVAPRSSLYAKEYKEPLVVNIALTSSARNHIDIRACSSLEARKICWSRRTSPPASQSTARNESQSSHRQQRMQLGRMTTWPCRRRPNIAYGTHSEAS